MRNFFTHYKALLFIFLYSNIASLTSQTSAIKGNIKDKDSGRNLENAFVNIEKTNSHSHTDDNGNFFFVNVPAGAYDIEFEKPG